MRKKIFSSLGLIACFLWLNSHHYVLVPERFVYQKGDTIRAHLMVGEVFDYEFERELQHEMTSQFLLITSNKVHDFLPVMKDSVVPAGELIVDFEGIGMVVMERKPALISLKPGEFHNYLVHDRVNGIIFDSARWKQEVVKEKYSRYIKSLIVSETRGNEDFFLKPVGLKLELMILKNPYRLMPDEELPVQVLLDGKPLKNVTLVVTMQTYGDEIALLVLHADKKGMVSFRPTLDATCVVTCVFIQKSADETEADFESLWASYSFKVLNGGE